MDEGARGTINSIRSYASATEPTYWIGITTQDGRSVRMAARGGGGGRFAQLA